jgi:hypothetical protein
MLDMVKYVAAVCAPAMAIVARVSDSAEDRRDRAVLSELNRLHAQLAEPESDSCPPTYRVSHRGKHRSNTCEEMT